MNVGPTIPITRPWLPDADVYHAVIQDILDRRFVSNFSKYATLLEQRAAPIIGNDRPFAVASCDVGLTLAWRALGVTEGEVLVPSFTFCSTVNALRWNGLEPVFVDINPRTLCLDPDDARRKINDRTTGICAVHVFGRPAHFSELHDLAAEHGLATVFDAAHALGAKVDDEPVGAVGDASVFSLSGTKLAVAGEGGLAVFRDPDAQQRFERLRNYGFLYDYNCAEVGLNGKLSEMNAAMGWLSLELLPAAIGRREELVECYRTELSGLDGLRFQAQPPHGTKQVHKDFAVIFDRPESRATVEEALLNVGVQTKRYFLPVHSMDAYAEHNVADLPVTESIYKRILCLPLFHDLDDASLRTVVRTIRRTIGS